jgi:glucokinase
VLVIGGSLTGAYDLFGPPFINALKKSNIDIQVEISDIMKAAAMIGSAKLLREEFWEKVKPLLSKMI